MSGGLARRVNRVMDHVRAHLDDELRLEDLAKVAHFSPAHFHRVFKALTGERLSAFVQRSRLERAASLMKTAPERSLTELAHEVGFSSSSDFSRVFKRHYGVTPSSWDRKSRLDPQHVADDYAEQVRVSREKTPDPEVEIVERASRRLAYVRVQTPFLGPRLQEGYAQLTEWLDARDVDWRARELLGWSWDNPETTPLEQVHFAFGFVVDDALEEEPDSDVAFYTFPAHRAARVHVRGALVRVAVAWDILFDDWLPTSRYEPAQQPAYKRFRTRPDELGWEKWDLECCLALTAT